MRRAKKSSEFLLRFMEKVKLSKYFGNLFCRSRRTIRMELTQATDDIYTFGIYGRDFAKDGDEPNGATSSVLINSIMILMFTVLSLKYLW